MVGNKLGFWFHFQVDFLREHFCRLNVQVLHHLHVKGKHGLGQALAFKVDSDEAGKQLDPRVLFLVSMNSSYALLDILTGNLLKAVLLKV